MVNGDKFLCKKNNHFLKEGNYYEIDQVINDNGNILVDVCGDDRNGIVLVVDLSDTGLLRKNTYFYNTFYTKKEERKLKLDKINENRLCNSME